MFLDIAKVFVEEQHEGLIYKVIWLNILSALIHFLTLSTWRSLTFTPALNYLHYTYLFVS